jgi:glycosyltransferase involved in cell wall biosynthesis
LISGRTIWGEKIKIACVSHYDPTDMKGYSARGYYQVQCLKNQAVKTEYFQPSRQLPLSLIFGVKRLYHRLQGRYYISGQNPFLVRSYARELSKWLSKVNVDLVFTPLGGPAWKGEPTSYLECDQPIVSWTDAPFIAHIEGFRISQFHKRVCKDFVRDGLANERSLLSRASLMIYTSDWAAQMAIKNYHVTNVKVVPFGPYMERNATTEDIEKIVNDRSHHECKLLFVGADWHRKGGNLALKVAEGLNKRGLKTKLTIVGCQPPNPLPSFARHLGNVGSTLLAKLYSESHFFIMPSLFEAFGVVFAEASSFGVPSLVTKVGGIPTAILDDFNGKTFPPDANAEVYCDYVLNLFSHFSDYRALALSSFNQYKTRLNWAVAGQTVKNLMTQLL